MRDILSVVLRALSFVLLFQAAGIAIFVAAFGRRLASARRVVVHLGQISALAATVLVAGHYALEAARMAGEMSGMLDPDLQGIVWQSSSRAPSHSAHQGDAPTALEFLDSEEGLRGDHHQGHL
jgi:high-affinity Fe2+/Pb2+ permease